MTKQYSTEKAPNYKKWILIEWQDGYDGCIKYETDYLYSCVNWKNYVKRNNIIKWCYIDSLLPKKGGK